MADQRSTIVKIPPHDSTAEKAVLGSMLIDSAALSDVAETLRPKHFYFRENRVIYEAILRLFDKSVPIDAVTVGDELKDTGDSKTVGGQEYLTELIDIVPTSAYVKHYADIVKNMYIKRTIISIGSSLVEEAFEEGGDVTELLGKAESEIFSISQAFLHRDFVELKEILAQSFDRLEAVMKNSGGIRGVPTGFNGLDKKLAGMQDSNLIILAARPGVGKTTFALNMAMHIALHEKMPIGFFSLEMSKEELVDRLLVGQADIDAWKLKTGRLSEDDHARLVQAMGELSEAPLYIDDTPGASILEMRTKVRKLAIEKDLKLIVVDYLQLAVPGKRFDSRVQEVGFISQSLKNMARELQVPVLALSQLSRAIEHRGEKRPQLADLRESGCITGDSYITLADTGERAMIRDLVGKKDFNVWSMTSDQKIKKMPVAKAFRTGIKPVYTLLLASGRKIRATNNHKFQTLEGWKRLDKLKIGEALAEPRRLASSVHDNEEFSDDTLILIAHMIGDGCYVERQPIHYTSATMEHIEVVNQAAHNVFGISGRVVEQESYFHTYLPSPYALSRSKRHPFMKYLESHDMSFARSYEKHVPEKLFTCSHRQIALFLKHLWSTDGSIHAKNDSVKIYYATTSYDLATEIQALLLRIGVMSTLRTVPQRKGSRQYRDSYNVDVQGSADQVNFLKHVGAFGNKRKGYYKALEILSKKIENPNRDVFDKDIWRSIIKKEKCKTTLSWREISRQLNTAYSGSSLFKSGLSRKRLGLLAEILDSTILREFAHSDLTWDKIIDISYDGEEEVFDLTVPRTHNFIANDIVVHNSIEQDADVVMFLYADDDSEELMDASKKMVKLFIAKHRNGPTGEIDLIFRGDRVRFFDVDTGVDVGL